MYKSDRLNGISLKKMEDPVQQAAHVLKKSKTTSKQPVKRITKTTSKSASVPKGKDMFVKIHDQTYIHADLFKDLVNISFEQDKDSRGQFHGNFRMFLGFRNNMHSPITSTIAQNEINNVAKRIRNYVKKYSKMDLTEDDIDAELEKHENGDIVSSTSSVTAVNVEKRKREDEEIKIFGEYSEDESQNDSDV